MELGKRAKANQLVFKPTKTWLREHKTRPKECPNTDCICIIDNFNHNHQGYCVGYYGLNGDLDMVSLCWVGWDKENKELQLHNALLHPQEATNMAMFLNWAVGAMWQMIPEYRKQIGIMLRKRTHNVNKLRHNGQSKV